MTDQISLTGWFTFWDIGQYVHYNCLSIDCDIIKFDINIGRDVDNFIDPLSPNHLIPGRAVATRGEDIVNIKETQVSVWSLNKSYKYIQFLMETFWRNGQMNILKNLENNSEWFFEPKIFEKFMYKWRILVYNKKTLRSQWKIAKISQLVKSNDGRICGAIVLMKTNGTDHLIKRTLNSLYPLKYDKKDEDVKIRFVNDANIKMMQKTDI